MIYLDNAAFSVAITTGDVRSYANPHSRSHSLGVTEKRGVENARNSISSLLGMSPEQVVFTSGATESADILWRCLSVPWEIPKLEHKCLSSKIGILRELRTELFPSCVYAKMCVNNETGIITNLNDKLEVEAAVLVSDITQAVGKLPEESWSFADFCFGSAHKGGQQGSDS